MNVKRVFLKFYKIRSFHQITSKCPALSSNYPILNKLQRLGTKALEPFFLARIFKEKKINISLFPQKLNSDILIVLTYVDDIILGSSNSAFYKNFTNIMKREFGMSLMGELPFFMRL